MSKFVKLEETLLSSKKFTSTEKLVIAWLSSWCKSNSSYCGGYQRLADKLGITKTALLNVLDTLKKKGIITISKEYRAVIVVNFSLLNSMLTAEIEDSELVNLFKIVYSRIKRS